LKPAQNLHCALWIRQFEKPWLIPENVAGWDWKTNTIFFRWTFDRVFCFICDSVFQKWKTV